MVNENEEPKFNIEHKPPQNATVVGNISSQFIEMANVEQFWNGFEALMRNIVRDFCQQMVLNDVGVDDVKWDSLIVRAMYDPLLDAMKFGLSAGTKGKNVIVPDKPAIGSVIDSMIKAYTKTDNEALLKTLANQILTPPEPEPTPEPLTYEELKQIAIEKGLLKPPSDDAGGLI